jgi:ankyrin repeat protein
MEFGPHKLMLDEDMLQVLIAGNKVRFEKLLRGDGRGVEDGQVAINLHGAAPAAAAPARSGTDRLLGVTSNGSTALHIVASHGHAELAAVICERAPSLAATRNRCLDTPLHCAAKAGHRELAACLLRTMQAVGTDAGRALQQSRNQRGSTALHEAIRHGHVDVIDLMMTRAPWLASVTSDSGVSALYMAAANHSVQMVQVLLRPSQNGGPSPASAAGPEGRTALHIAAISSTKGTR